MPHLGERAVKGFDTTSSPEFQLLQSMYQSGLYLSESQLARDVDLSRGAVSTGVRRLWEKGLLDKRHGPERPGNLPATYKLNRAGMDHAEMVMGDDWY